MSVFFAGVSGVENRGVDCVFVSSVPRAEVLVTCGSAFVPGVDPRGPLLCGGVVCW